GERGGGVCRASHGGAPPPGRTTESCNRRRHDVTAPARHHGRAGTTSPTASILPAPAPPVTHTPSHLRKAHVPYTLRHPARRRASRTYARARPRLARGATIRLMRLYPPSSHSTA